MFDLFQVIEDISKSDPNLSLPVVTFKALLQYTRQSTALTAAEFSTNLDTLKKLLAASTARFVLLAGYDMFINVKTKVEDANVDLYSKEFREKIIEAGINHLKDCENDRESAAQHGCEFIKNGSVILVHSYSRLVMLLLRKAAQRFNFKVFVTQTAGASAQFSGYHFLI